MKRSVVGRLGDRVSLPE